MLFRFARLWMAVGLVALLWALNSVREPDNRSWVRTVGTEPGPVRITRFYASVGTLIRGEKALLCYGVENAKSVRISPMMQRVSPSVKSCMEIAPEHTTHYTLLAEGFDGRVITQSFTLPVQAQQASPPQILNIAERREPLAG
jgi:hypothetical protein